MPFITSTPEAEAGRSLRFPGQLSLHSKFQTMQGRMVRPCIQNKGQVLHKSGMLMHHRERLATGPFEYILSLRSPEL